MLPFLFILHSNMLENPSNYNHFFY
jgi:Galactosyltransferase